MKLQKTLYTLNVNGYCPAITELTYPLLRHYARKIHAEFVVIDSRRWPERPAVYEKLQIHDLMATRGDFWAIYVDSDTLIHPDMFDVTEHLTPDTVCHFASDMAGIRWRYDDYFRRDGRHFGSCNWFTVASCWCRDLWREPDDLCYEDALDNIFPTQAELGSVITREHLIDDYLLSRNIARFGLKSTTVRALLNALGDRGDYFYHEYTRTTEDKVKEMQSVLERWQIRLP